MTFTKHWGAASPQLFAALVANEVLTSAPFEFVEIDPQGVEQVFQTGRLTNAAVSSIHQSISLDPAGGPQHVALEEVALTFQKIYIEDKAGKTLSQVPDPWAGNGEWLPGSVDHLSLALTTRPRSARPPRCH